MIKLPEIDPIDFLVARKFPPRVLAVLPSAGRTDQNVSPPLSTAERTLRARQSEDYRAILSVMPADELEALFKSEREKADKEFLARLDKGESGRFFHRTSANADFEHWSKAAHWTLDEAVALSFGKAPEVVNSPALRTFQNISPFAARYARLLDLARRAASWKQLYDPVLPILFTKWAEQNDIEFPAALAEKVISRSGSYIDWKQKYEKLEPLLGDWERICAEQVKTIETGQSQIESLMSELEQVRLEAAVASVASPAEKPQSPRERMGMLKVIYAMAIRGYAFDPTAKRSNLVAEIVGDLALQGLSVSDDTIRRYIKEACDLLPEWREDNR
jgi:hypothetical protein